MRVGSKKNNCILWIHLNTFHDCYHLAASKKIYLFLHRIWLQNYIEVKNKTWQVQLFKPFTQKREVFLHVSMSPYSIANQISFSFLHLIHPLLHMIFADLLYHPERWKSLKSSHWRSNTLSRQLVREWSTLKINQENTCQHSLWKFNKFKPHGSANVQCLFPEGQTTLQFKVMWNQQGNNNTFLCFSFVYFILFQWMVSSFASKIVREILACLACFRPRSFSEGIFPKTSPPCKAHCSASSKIKRLKAMRDSTVFIFQPWFQVIGGKLCCWYPIVSCLVGWFNTSSNNMSQNGNLPQFSGWTWTNSWNHHL